MSGTVILKCTCKHRFQDTRYNSKRVHNRMGDGKRARCTVCGNVKDFLSAQAEKGMQDET